MQNYYVKGDFIKSRKKATISKRALKMAIFKVLSLFYFIFNLAGIVAIVGIIGKSDTEILPIAEIFKFIILAVLFFIFGKILKHLKEVLK